MAEKQLDKGSISFQTEGRLLQELGERLVASPEVALVELVKNSYDADATSCEVSLSDRGTKLVVDDDGDGMTYEQFATRWMRIATRGKVADRSSPTFKRRLTGQKGIGRFAVRFLGKSLHLDSVAFDQKQKCKTRLVADFDWAALDEESKLDDAQIPYRLFQADASEPTGTTLTVEKLRVESKFAQSNEFRTAVLKIVSPLRGLDGGRFSAEDYRGKKDPGFKVVLPGEATEKDDLDLAAQLLGRAWARLTIDLTEDTLNYTVKFENEPKPSHLRTKISSSIRNGVVADIRYFPRRAGIFRGVEVNGPTAWEWIRENSGVAVIDHGFRVPPYGLADDDWIKIDADGAHNDRDWRSSISKKRFPIMPTIRNDDAQNPMLMLATNFQLVGAVFVESAPVGSRTDRDLITSMDREGFLFNDAFEQLIDIIRGGVEFLAREDRASQQRDAERKAKEKASKAKADFKAAIKFIERSPTLAKPDKVRIIREYTELTEKLEEVEDYNQAARQRLETMSALGVVSAFMTHEASRIVASLGDVLDELRRIARRHPAIKKDVERIEESYRALEGHLEYTKTFIDATQHGNAAVFKAAGQIKFVIDKFGDFAAARKIQVLQKVAREVDAPKMPVAVYSGILLNLYTNALKAILAVSSPKTEQKILFQAHNDRKMHIIEVMDTGIGIPPNMQKRVWDPLFTTTSSDDNPLGAGMGLGLSLVKSLVESRGGRVNIVEPAEGFTTCFRVQLPLR